MSIGLTRPSPLDMPDDGDIAERRENVHSLDGTQIAYTTFVVGPSILMVPGALETIANFSALADALSTSFTIHIVERRGRGASGGQEDVYSVDHECEGLLAGVDATYATTLASAGSWCSKQPFGMGGSKRLPCMSVSDW
jgi:hypothetical protein